MNLSTEIVLIILVIIIIIIVIIVIVVIIIVVVIIVVIIIVVVLKSRIFVRRFAVAPAGQQAAARSLHVSRELSNPCFICLVVCYLFIWFYGHFIV